MRPGYMERNREIALPCSIVQIVESDKGRKSRLFELQYTGNQTRCVLVLFHRKSVFARDVMGSSMIS